METKYLNEPIHQMVIYHCEQFVKEKGKNISTSQLRKIFGEIKYIQSDFEKNKIRIPLLLPNLAYHVGKNPQLRNLYDEIKDLLIELSKDINNREKFERFVQIFEIIISYHKFYFPNK